VINESLESFESTRQLWSIDVVHVQAASDSSEAKKADEQAKSAPEPPLEKAIIDHFSETLLPGRRLCKQKLIVSSVLRRC